MYNILRHVTTTVRNDNIVAKMTNIWLNFMIQFFRCLFLASILNVYWFTAVILLSCLLLINISYDEDYEMSEALLIDKSFLLSGYFYTGFPFLWECRLTKILMKHRRTTQVIRKNPHSDFCLKRLDIQNYRFTENTPYGIHKERLHTTS